MRYADNNGKRFCRDIQTGCLSEEDSVVLQPKGEIYERGKTTEKEIIDGFVKGFNLACCLFLFAAVIVLTYSKNKQTEAETAVTDVVKSEISEESVRVENKEEINEESELLTNDYVMPYIDSCYLTDADIADMDLNDIQLVINELYARHGHEFIKQDCREYFSSKSWYRADPKKSDEAIVSEMNKYERANRALLIARRDELRGYVP